MNISKHIDFKGIKVSKVFHNDSKQYSIFTNMNEEKWKQYCNAMLKENVRVKYDAKNDSYMATLLKENQMTNKKFILHDEDNIEDDGMDLEQDVSGLITSIDDEVIEPIMDEPEVDEELPGEVMTEPSVMGNDPSVLLSQLEDLFSKFLGGNTTENPAVEELPVEQIPNEGTFDNNVLETEFQTNAGNIGYIKDRIDTESWMGAIDPGYNAKSDVLNNLEIQNTEEEEPLDELNEWGASENEDYTYATSSLQNGKLNEDDDEGEDDLDDLYNKVDHVTNVLKQNGFTDLEEDYVRDFLEFELEFNTIDLNDTNSIVKRWEAYVADTDMDDMKSLDEEEEIGEVEPEEISEPITANGTAKILGQPVQIVLTGVMISPSEITQVAEAVKRSGAQLKAVKGSGSTINFVVESKNKKYTITYEDLPHYKSKTPFSIKEYKFTSLNEALDTIKINQEKMLKEAKTFKKMLNSDIAKRSITDIKESDILSQFDGKISEDYISGWNLKSVGAVNLKTGLNETYSNITQHSKESNTLVKTKDGQFYLIKGNLRERSQLGTKKQLVDLESKKDYGVGTVIGIYENNQKGLGQIMYKIKRTSIPLLTWRQ